MHGVVVAPQPEAVDVGARTLRAGGNAIDAVIATACTQMVIDQMMCGVAGGGIAQVYSPSHNVHEVSSFFLEAPGALHEGIWADRLIRETADGYGYILRDRVNDVGYSSVGIPGTLRGLARLHAKFGSKDWADLLVPAIEAARNGYTVTPAVHAFWTLKEGMGRIEFIDRLRMAPHYSQLFFEDGGEKVHPIGTKVQNPDLANTLEAIALRGADDFYEGQIAAAITADFAKHGGYLSPEDLQTYQPIVSEPVKANFRDLTFSVNDAPGSGVQILFMLGVLQHFDLAAMEHNGPDYIATVSEVMRRAQSLKDNAIYDPRVQELDKSKFLDPALHAAMAAEIKSGAKARIERYIPETKDTTHISAIDSAGNCVSLTHTNAMPSGVMTPGLGFMYNGGLGAMDPRPGRAQSLRPRRTRSSSMSPIIVFDRGTPLYVIGAPGGSNIPMGILQVILNLVEFRMTPVEAVSAARFSAVSNVIDVASRIPSYTCEALQARGYEVRRHVVSYLGARVQVAKVKDGKFSGASDPGGQGMALVV